jgi:hypothetical protein
MAWHFLFPTGSSPLAPDEIFADQFTALTAAGHTASLCPDSVLAGTRTLRSIPAGQTVVYRGWMATDREYGELYRAIEQASGVPLTNPMQYLAAHHLPNWYPLIADLTPETRVYSLDADLESELHQLGWPSFFIKDYVKSLKTGLGSIVTDPAAVVAVIEELRESRGRIEGGICVRRVEEFVLGSEMRYFVLNGTVFAPDDSSVPNIVHACAERVRSPFFSVDVARRIDGVWRVVEVGDGQVSDLVGWTAERFVELWRS